MSGLRTDWSNFHLAHVSRIDHDGKHDGIIMEHVFFVVQNHSDS